MFERIKHDGLTSSTQNLQVLNEYSGWRKQLGTFIFLIIFSDIFSLIVMPKLLKEIAKSKIKQQQKKTVDGNKCHINQ